MRRGSLVGRDTEAGPDIPSAPWRQLALTVRTPANDRAFRSVKIPTKRGRLPARAFFERTGCGWRPGRWSSYKDYTLPLTMRLRLEGKVGNAFLAASPARDS